MLFKDFLYSLVNFSDENSTLEDDYNKSNIEYSMNDRFYDETFSTDYFQSFIENKILKYKALYEEALEEEKITTIFKEGFLALNNALGLKLAQNAQQKGNENADKTTIVKKGHAIAYGILFCGGNNYEKVKALFNIFQQDGEIKTSDKFSEFLLSLFILSSYAMASARKKLKKYEEMGEFDEEKFSKLLDTSELKDCQNLVEVTNKLMFGQDLSASLKYQDFKKKFADESKNTSLRFLLAPSGVRFMLNKNNI